MDMQTDFEESLMLIASLMAIMPPVRSTDQISQETMNRARQFLQSHRFRREAEVVLDGAASEITVEQEMLSALKEIVASFHESVRTEEALSEFPSLKLCIDAIARAEGPERHKFSPAELEANAHLIAAAPDTKRELENSTRFLEALQILIPDEPEWMDLTLQTIQQIKDNKATIAKAAIAKAEGAAR